MQGLNGGNGNGKISFYAPGYFPSSKPSVPPIFATTSRRPKEALEVDGKLREAANSQELWQLISSFLPRFDTGNVVVAFTTAAKLDEGVELHHQTFLELVDRLVSCMDCLEPRGLSMTAYSAAKLLYGEQRFWLSLSAASCRSCHRFGATDVAKAAWAFAKLRFVDEMSEFWQCMVGPAIAACRGSNSGRPRFVDVSMIAWAFASSNQATAALMEEVARETLHVLPDLTPRSLAGIAWAFARFGEVHQQLFTQLRERAKLVVREFSAHDAAAFCWAFSKLGCADLPLFTDLAMHLDSDGGQRAASSLRRLSPPLAAEFAWALASAKVEAPSVFATLEDLCVSNIEVLETEDVCGFAWAFAVCGRGPASPSTFEAISRYAERYAGRLRPSEVSLLSWALQGRASIGPTLARRAVR